MLECGANKMLCSALPWGPTRTATTCPGGLIYSTDADAIFSEIPAFFLSSMSFLAGTWHDVTGTETHNIQCVKNNDGQYAWNFDHVANAVYACKCEIQFITPTDMREALGRIGE